MRGYKYYYLALALFVAAAAKCAAFTPPVRLAERRIHRSDLHPVVGISSMREIRRHPSILHSSTTGDQPVGNYIRPYIKQLLLLCRPSNFPVVALFHALGVFQAVQLWVRLVPRSYKSCKNPVNLPCKLSLTDLLHGPKTSYRKKLPVGPRPICFDLQWMVSIVRYQP